MSDARKVHSWKVLEFPGKDVEVQLKKVDEISFKLSFEVFTKFEFLSRGNFNHVSYLTESWLIILLYWIIDVIEAMRVSAHAKGGHIIGPNRPFWIVDVGITSWNLEGDVSKHISQPILDSTWLG